MEPQLSETGHGFGALPHVSDERDYQFGVHLGGGTPDFNWELGYDIEQELGFPIPSKDQNGSYSCFHGDTPVLMEDFSYRPISKVTKGDIVFTHTGVKNVVLNTFQRKWQGTTKIVSVYGDYKKLECTKEHPFFALKREKNKWGEENGKTTWIPQLELIKNQQPDFYEINELKAGDWIAYPIINLIKDTTLHSFEKDADFLWILGLYLAEGCTNKYGVVFSLHQDEFEWFEKIKRIMGKYGANVTCNFKKGDKGMSIHVFGEKWSNIFSELGSNYCDKKKIADRLMVIEPSLQMNIVRGLQDGDGHYRRNTVTIKSTSSEMLEQMRIILMRNGIYSSLCKEKKYDGKKQAYTLEYNLKGNSRYHFVRDNHIFVQIKSIEHKKDYMAGLVYNLEVEDDNSYLVNGIAVHNCGGQAWSYLGGVLKSIYHKCPYAEDSAKFIYAQTFVAPGGSDGRTNSQLVVKQGWGLESDTPSYQNGLPAPEAFYEAVSDISDTARQNAKQEMAIAYATVPTDIDTIAQAIRDNHGVIIGVNGQNNGTWRTAFPIKPLTGEPVWRHWLYCGKAKVIEGKKYIGIKNSWGNIADNGWQWLSEDYFDGKNVWVAWMVQLNTQPSQLPLFTRTLVYGMKGDDVKQLQTLLGGLTVDGVFGNRTRAAVILFQTLHTLVPDGIVGPKTQQVLLSIKNS